jgi:hypothetical protein
MWITVTEPGKNLARPSATRTAKKIPIAKAKELALQGIKDGLSIREAMALSDRSLGTYNAWRIEDPKFRDAVAHLRDMAAAARKRGVEAVVVPDFPDFSATYLGHELPELHMRTYDMLCGDVPRNLHPRMVYHQGRSNLLLINYPPDHGKSTTWSVNYPTYRIIADPNSRGAIISKTGNLARQFLGAVKNRLTNPRYAELQKAFSPDGGFQGDSWTQAQIFVGGRDSGEKDPTLQALGMGSAVYGARLDYVVLDDCIDNSNAHRFDEQMQWLSTEVLTRLPDDGLVFILGTRIAPLDLYRKLRELLDYDDTTPLYSYLAQPAVLEADGPPETWKTLWPDRWPGPALARRKATLGSDARWALVFQQQDVSEEAVFPAGAVEASVNKSRAAGSLHAGTEGYLADPNNVYVVAGLDPATTGYTSMSVVALDRTTGKRIVLDGFNKANTTPMEMRERIEYFTERYKVKCWVIETNAYQRSISQDDSLRTWLFSRGCRIREHHTSHQAKFDADYGIMSMAALFLSCVDPVEGDPWRRKVGGGLIDLPNRQFSQFTDTLINQLITWTPKGGGRGVKTDALMSLWFCELECKEHLDGARTAPRHSHNPFLPKRERDKRRVIRLEEYAQAAIAERVGGPNRFF